MDELLRLIWGYRVSQAIHVAALIGVPDLLAEGPQPVSALAEATGVNADALRRLLRALTTHGLLDAPGDDQFALTELGQRLRSDVDGSLRDAAIGLLRRSSWEAWGHLADSVRTGENAFRLVNGVSVWEYGADHPEERLAFDRTMIALTRAAAPAIVAAYDFSRFRKVVDVGGGRGSLIEAIVTAHPNVEGVLYDQPHVVATVDLGPRIQVIAGSFFESVPAGGDAYMLKWILHDYEADDCVAILRTIRQAAGAAARLLVIERELSHPETTLSDLNMLVLPGGRERSTHEYRALLADAGFELHQAFPTGGPLTIFEALPV